MFTVQRRGTPKKSQERERETEGGGDEERKGGDTGKGRGEK